MLQIFNCFIICLPLKSGEFIAKLTQNIASTFAKCPFRAINPCCIWSPVCLGCYFEQRTQMFSVVIWGLQCWKWKTIVASEKGESHSVSIFLHIILKIPASTIPSIMGGLIDRISPVSEWVSQSSLFSFNFKAGLYGQLICFYLPNPSCLPSIYKAQNLLPHWNEYRNYTGYCSRIKKRFLTNIKGVSKGYPRELWTFNHWLLFSEPSFPSTL